MKTSHKILSGLCLACLVAGYLIGYTSRGKQIETITVTEIQWQDKIVYRDYAKLTPSEIISELTEYDTAKPRLDISQSGGIITATAGLHRREWSRQVIFEQRRNIVFGGAGYGYSGASLQAGYMRAYGNIGGGLSLAIGENIAVIYALGFYQF